MPTIIDESVVKLSLDNGEFEKASDKTINKLDDLKRSLQFDGAIDGFKEIEKAARQTDFSPMEKGVEAVSIQFNALATIADTALRRVINTGIDSVERTLKSLTIDNVTAGWSKYADKTSAVQTIMAATAKEFDDTGAQMEYVETQLEKLNWFTDETSYAFLDMVNNIGKFTSNQIGLDDAVTAMQGISNWAAISGAGIQGASRAMYNLAQAIGVGSVKLIDWKSIENANMATAEFKEMALQAAAAKGTIIDLGNGIYQTLGDKGKMVSIKNFSENLSEGWFTSEVLMDTLAMYGKFTDELYKLAEITDMSATPLIRYINEYKDGTLDLQEAMTATGLKADELIDWLEKLGSKEMDLGRRAFAAAQEAKTFEEALSATKEAVASGWMQSFEYIFGNYEEAKELWSDLAEGLYEVFVESGNMRNGLLRDWKALGGRTYLIDGIRTLLSRLASAVEFVKDTFESIFPPKTAEQLVEMTKGFQELMDLLVPSENTIQSIQNVLTLLFTAMQKVGQVAIVVVAGLEPIWELIGQISGAIIGLIGDISKLLGFKLDEVFSADALTNLYNIIYSISTIIANIARVGFVGIIAGAANIIKFIQDIWTTFKAGEGGIKGFVDAIIVNFRALFSSIYTEGSVIKTFVDNIIDNFKRLIAAISGGEGIKGILTNILGFFTGDTGIKGAINSIITAIGSLFNSIRSGNSIFSGLFLGIYSIAKTAFDGISALVEKIFESFNADNIDSNPVANFFKSVGEAVSESDLLTNIQAAASTLLGFVSSMFGFVANLDTIAGNLKTVVGVIVSQFEILWNWFVTELTQLSLRDVADVYIIVMIGSLVSSLDQLSVAIRKTTDAATKTLTAITTFINTAIGSQNPITATITALSNLAANTKYLQIGASIMMIANSLAELAKLPVEQLGVAISSMITVIGLLIILEKALGNTMVRLPDHGRIETAASNIFKLALSIATISAGLSLLTNAISVGFFENTENGREFSLTATAAQITALIAAVAAIGLLLLEIAGVVAIINKINPGDGFAKAAVGMTGLATGVLVLSAAVTVLSLLPIPNLIQGAAAVATVTMALGLAGAALGDVNVASVLSGASAATLFAFALVELMVPLVVLGELSKKYDLNELRQNLEMLMVFLTVAVAGIGVVGANAVVLAAASVAMVAFAGSVVILAGAMHLMTGIDFDSFWMGLTLITAAFVGFAVVAGIAQASALGLMALAAVFIAFSASVALLALTIKLIAQAAAEFAVITLAFVAAGEQLGEEFPAKVDYAMGQVQIVIHSFLNMLIGLTADIARTATMLILALKTGMLMAMPDIITALLIIGKMICDAIVEFGPTFLDALVDMIMVLKAGVPKILSALGLLVEEIFAGLGVIIYDALIGLVRGILNILGLSGLADKLGIFAHEAADAVGNGFESGLNLDETQSSGEQFGNAFGAGLKSALTGEVTTVAKDTAEGLKNGLEDEERGVRDAAEGLGDTTIDALSEGLGVESPSWKAEEAGDYTGQGLEHGLDAHQGEAYTSGYNLGQAAIEGMKDGAGTHSDSWKAAEIASWIAGGFNNQMQGLYSSFEETGFMSMTSHLTGMVTGAQEGGRQVGNAMDAILKMVGIKADAIQEAVSFSYEIGNADMAGLKPQERLSIAKEAAKAGKQAGVTAGKSYNDALNTSFDDILTSGVGTTGSKGGSSGKSSGSKASAAAEKVKTAAEEIIESYKAALEELDYLDKKHKGEYNLFDALNPDITELEKNTNKLEYVNKQIETQLKRTEIAEEKYHKIAKAMGEASEEARNAEIEWIEAQVTLAELQNERIETQNSIIENASKQLEIQQKNAELTYKLWQSTNQSASKLEQEEKKLEYTLAKLEYASNNVEEATKAYNEALEKYGEDATETKELMNELIQAQIDYAEIAEEVNEVQDAIVNLGVQQAELALENQSLAYDIWIQTHKNASQAEKEAKKTEEIMLRYEAKMQDLADATEAWKTACEEFGEESLEATEAYNAMLKAEKETLEGLDELRESEKAHLEYLTEELAIYAEQADLEDQLWETVNTAATNEERYLHDRDTLIRKQLVAEQERLILQEEYNRLLEEEGKDSQNTRKAYAEILKKQIEIAGYVQDQKDLEASLVQTAKEELSIASKRADLEDQLWETVSENATKEEKLARKTATLTRNKATAEKELVLLVKEYNRLLEQEGKESQNTLNAYNAILEKQIEIAGYLKDQKDLAAEALQNELDELEFEEKRLDVANQLWQATNSHASESLKYSHEVEQNTAKMVLSMKELNKLSEQYNAQIKRYGQNSEEARSAWEAYAQKQIEIIELQNERKELELEIIQNELDMISLAESRAKTEYEIWEALNEDLSDSAKKTKQISYQMQTLEYATEKLRTASKKYNYALKMYGEESKETQQLYNDMLSAQLEYVKTHNELKSLQAEILEKNNDILEQLQYSEKLLDYGYNMWEKLNDDISDAQKIEAQIKKLNQDLLLQVQRANYYGAEWKKAVAQYGSASAEAQEAYLNYLEALYKALDTQSSIADKETELTDLRTENAQKLQDAWDEVKAKDLVGGTSIYDELVDMGLSEAEIEQYVKEKAGIIEDTIGTEMDFSIENMQSKAEDALREWGLTWIDGTYEVADTVVTTAGDTMGEMSSIIAEGAAEGEAAAQQAMDEIESIVEEGAEEVVDTVEEGGEDTVAAIEEALQQLIDAIANDTGQAAEAMDNLCNEIYTTATSEHLEDYLDIGLYMTLGIQQGILRDKWNVIDSSISIMEEAIWWAKDQDFESIGSYMTMGIQQGILSGKWYVIDSIIQVIQEAIWWANQTAQIRSPSRVTMWMGEMLDAGFVEGIEKRAGEIARSMASAVQNGINAANKVLHTSNTVEFAGDLIAGGITGAIEGYSYNILSVGQAVLNTLADEYDEMVDDIIGDNQWLIDALREYGFDETTHGIEFVVNLDADEARTTLENLFALREENLEYYDDLLDMQERNAAKDQRDWAVKAEAQAIAKELNRVMKSIESYEEQIEDIVKSGRSSSFEDSIAGKKLEYVQNIYSTKPLSALDIYRNTNSQLLRFTTWR